MLYLHFIVNPISGNGKHIITASLLHGYFPKDQYTIVINYTTHKEHAIELAQKAVMDNPDYIIACGGDGTINEVASCLVNSTIKLGIIPVGSGNGLASNLNIPKNIGQAIEIIRNGKVSVIDVGSVNNRYFFSNMGIGIDAMIIRKYEQSGKRTLLSYIWAAMSSSFDYKPEETTVVFNKQTTTIKPLLLFISNSNEMGYNMSLTPKASLSDGLLDLIIVPELSFIEKFLLGYAVLRNGVEKFKKAKHILVKEFAVDMPDKIYIYAQIDGEYHNLESNRIKISVIEKGIKVITV